MRYALIEGGCAHSFIDHNPAGRYHPDLLFVACDDTVSEGDLYNPATGTFSAPMAPALAVPAAVSRFQARAILHIDGHLATVEALIGSADPITQMAWQDAQEFRRSSPAIAGIADALNWSAAYLDDLFIRAARIEA